MQDDSTASQFTSTLRHVLGAQEGDQLSWTRLENKVRPWIERRLANEELPRDQEPDDIVQSVLFELFRTFDKLVIKSREAFRSWVLKVTENKLTDLWRRARAGKRDEGRRLSLEGDSETPGSEAVDPAHGPSTVARSHELEERVEKAMRRLPRGDREIIRLREEEGMPYDEIARLWDYQKPETVRKRFWRARERRREELDALARELLESGIDDNLDEAGSAAVPA